MLNIAKRRYSVPLLVALVCLLLPAIAAASTGKWPLNMTKGVTDLSHEIYDLHMLIFYICCVIGVLVFGAMFYSMYAHRQSKGAQAANFHHSTAVEIAWTLIPAVILIGMAFPATSSLKKVYNTDDADIDILVTGYQWKWKYEYLGQDVSFFSNLKTTQEEIWSDNKKKPEHYLLDVDKPLLIPTGKKVRFLVTAADVIHSWWVPDLAVKRDAIPGYIHEAWTKVEKEGVYRGQCAELCGKDHGFMPIEVHAVSPQKYEAWLGEERKKALQMAELAKKTFSFDELYEQGEQVYKARCAACHGMKGEGSVGPAIGGSKVAMGPISQHLSVVIKGVTGTAMQAFAEQLNEVEAAAVITFQRNAYGNNMGDIIQPIDVLKFKQQ